MKSEEKFLMLKEEQITKLEGSHFHIAEHLNSYVLLHFLTVKIIWQQYKNTYRKKISKFPNDSSFPMLFYG